MKRLIYIAGAALVFVSTAAFADLYAAGPMQACSSNADCTLVSQNCTTACETLPINGSYRVSYEQQLATMCGGSIPGNLPHCTVKPALQPACIHNRCTIGYAFQNHASAGDINNNGVQGPPER